MNEEFDKLRAELFEVAQTVGDSSETPKDDQVYLEVAAQREEAILEALAKQGVQFGQLEFGIIGAIADEHNSIQEIRDEWDMLAARHIADDNREDESYFDALEIQMEEHKRRAELLSFAAHITTCSDKNVPELTSDLVVETIAQLTSSKLLDSSERTALLNVLEEVVGEDDFSAAMTRIGEGNQLEEEEIASRIDQLRAVDRAQQFQRIQAILIQDFQLSNIEHEDWLSFAQRLQRLINTGEDESAFLRHQYDRLVKGAARLGVTEELFERIIRTFEITPPRDH